jgi:hypothetical protein
MWNRSCDSNLNKQDDIESCIYRLKYCCPAYNSDPDFLVLIDLAAVGGPLILCILDSAGLQPFYNRKYGRLRFVTKKLSFRDIFVMNAGYISC